MTREPYPGCIHRQSNHRGEPTHEEATLDRCVVSRLGLAWDVRSGLGSSQVRRTDLSFVESGYFRVTLQVHSGASGAPGGFVVAWMKKSDYDLRGGWPVDEDDPAVGRCEFSGVPTLNVDLAAPSLQLAPSGRSRSEIGQPVGRDC